MRIPMVLSLLATVGCVAGVDESDLNVAVNYAVVPAGGATLPVITVSGDQVRVSHRFQTPASCYNFGSQARQRGAVVELVLTQRFGALPDCQAEVTEWSYAALIVGVRAGTERIGITYDTDGIVDRVEYPLPSP